MEIFVIHGAAEGPVSESIQNPYKSISTSVEDSSVGNPRAKEMNEKFAEEAQ